MIGKKIIYANVETHVMLLMCWRSKFECDCHSGPKPTKYNVGHWRWDNIHTLLPERGLNIGLHWCSHNVHTALFECFLDVGPQNWEWHCHNVAWTSSHHRFWMLGTDIETMFRQHCLNVVSMSVPNVESNVATMFTQHCWTLFQHCSPTLGSDVATTFTNLPERCLNIWPSSANVVTMWWQWWYFGRNTMGQCSHKLFGRPHNV